MSLRGHFEIHQTTTPCQSLNHSIYSVNVRQLYEKLERKVVNSHSTFPALGSDSYEVGLPSVVVRPGFALSNRGPSPQTTTMSCGQAPGQQRSSFMFKHAFQKQPAADRDCRESAEGDSTPFSTMLAALAYTRFLSGAHSYKGTCLPSQSDSIDYLVICALPGKNSLKRKSKFVQCPNPLCLSVALEVKPSWGWL